MGWFGRIITFWSRTFKANPKVINLNDEPLPDQCLLIGNHNAARGPVKYYAFLKKHIKKGHFMTWGAHPMCESYIKRWKYLYYIFYRQKLGYRKFRSFILATLFGAISGLIYKSAGIIPVYYDSRLRDTFKYTNKCLEQNVPVLIFPEDSSQGYRENVEKFSGGFLQASKAFYSKHEIDLPIYTIHYSQRNKNKIVIGKPMYYQELAKEHSKEEILQIFLDYMNQLKEIE